MMTTSTRFVAAVLFSVPMLLLCWAYYTISRPIISQPPHAVTVTHIEGYNHGPYGVKVSYTYQHYQETLGRVFVIKPYQGGEGSVTWDDDVPIAKGTHLLVYKGANGVSYVALDPKPAVP